MKIEGCFDEGKDWAKVSFAEQLEVPDFINILLRRGNTYYRINGKEKKKVEERNYPPITLKTEVCEICGRISFTYPLKEVTTCIYCVYHQVEENNLEEEFEEEIIPFF